MIKINFETKKKKNNNKQDKLIFKSFYDTTMMAMINMIEKKRTFKMNLLNDFLTTIANSNGN